MNNVKLTKEIIDGLAENAETSTIFTLSLYKHVYGAELWEKIASMNSFPSISKTTNEYIFTVVIAMDKRNKAVNFPGGVWMNNGFSSLDDTVKNWEVRPCEYTLK